MRSIFLATTLIVLFRADLHAADVKISTEFKTCVGTSTIMSDKNACYVIGTHHVLTVVRNDPDS